MTIPVAAVLLGLTPTGAPADASVAADSALTLLVSRGKAPAAALLAREETGTRYAHAEAVTDATTYGARTPSAPGAPSARGIRPPPLPAEPDLLRGVHRGAVLLRRLRVRLLV
ncbi:hypothetical protein ABZS63_39705, partial [Streptomyces sp. NPDC005568]